MDKVAPRLPFSKFSTKQFSESVAGKRFTGIYARDRPFVRRVLLRFGVPTRDVDDLVQEVFVIFWTHIDEIRLDVDPRPWLYTVAYYRAGNYRKLFRCTREFFLGDRSDAAGPGAADIDPGWVMDAYRSFARLMKRLSKKLRDVFVAYVLEGQSMQEVAASLRIPIKTAQSRVLLARAVVQRTCPFVTV